MTGLNKILYACVAVLVMLLTGCVHQWPEPPLTRIPMLLELRYQTDFYVWEHGYDPKTGIVWQKLDDSEGVDELHPATSYKYDNALYFTKAKMRYIVRAYNKGNFSKFVDEFVFIRDVNANFDCNLHLELLPGEYDLYVWSDLFEIDESQSFYDPANFLSLALINTPYVANTEWRDAFRGETQLDITGFINDMGKTEVVEMRRPMAKFELVTTDLSEFLDRETQRINSLQSNANKAPTVKAQVNDYKVRIHYSGYLPSVYSVLDDRLVDSEVGKYFTTIIEPLNDQEASIGFDYVLINDIDRASVAIQVEVLTLSDERVALSYMVSVPLRRDHHTILRSPFMTIENEGGVYIDPDFDGDYNIIL